MTVTERDVLEVIPQTGFTGAEVRGIDLAAPLDDDTVSKLRQALLAWKVIFARDQHLDDASHVALARRFGQTRPRSRAGYLDDSGNGSTPEIFSVRYEYPPFDENATPHIQQWHIDGANTLEPPAILSIRVDTARAYGGDTNFSNLVTAYETLPAKVRAFADGLRVVNRFPPHLTRGNAERLRALELNPVITEHPVVRIHPETGERALFVEPTHSSEIVGLTPRQSRYVLDIFFDEINKPEHVFRLRWETGTVALWDNRATAHYAPNDLRHLGHRVGEREAYRVALLGDRPAGPDGRPSRALRGGASEEGGN